VRNRYPGRCADGCGTYVPVQAGYFQRRNGRWLVRCMPCTIKGKIAAGKDLSDAQLERLKDV
jgi:hypothetical protein